MSCADLSGAYMDGELSADEAERFEAHARECAACGESLDGERALRARVAALPRELAPPTELWPRIAPRVRGPRPLARLRRGVAIGAGVASALAIAAAVVLLVRPRDPVGSAIGPIAIVATAAVPLLEEEAQYLTAVASLRVAFDEAKGAFPAETVRAAEEDLRVLERAVAATRGALAAHRDDEALKAALREEYQQQIEVLNDLLDLSTRT